MSTETRFIIDYVTGGIWIMPLSLFNEYECFCQRMREATKNPLNYNCVPDMWYATLSETDKAAIIKTDSVTAKERMKCNRKPD
jgi:hypothetical protein